MKTLPHRRYRKPLTSVQKMRLMRLMTMFRLVILEASLEEGEDRLEDVNFQREFVARHQAHNGPLWDEFPYVDIRGNRYASDVLAEVMKDAVYYVLHGDTPGGP